MKVEGNAGVYVAAQSGRPLPKLPDYLHRAHRPWCVDCKKKHLRADLDETGRCSKCAAAVITRAQGEERRARRDEAAVQAEAALLAKLKREPRPAPAAEVPPPPRPASPNVTPVRGPSRSVKTRGQGSNHRTATRLAKLGVSPLEVKRWAHEQGLVASVARGRVAADLVEAYAAAHGQSVAS